VNANAQTGLLYGLEDRPDPVRSFFYALQWIGFTLANVMVVPIVIGPYLGLDAASAAQLLQRVFFFVGLGSLLQLYWGHRLPIVEGTAGMWWAIFISLGSTAMATGKPLAILRTDLELGLMAAGAVTLLLGATGIIGRILQLFTPAVTGTMMVLLALELSSNAVPNMLGLGLLGDAIHGPTALLSLLVLACVAAVSLYGPRYLRSFGILVGMALGWAAFAALGLADSGWAGALNHGGSSADALAAAEQAVRAVGFAWPLAWGRPTFDPGVVLVCVMTALLVTANQVAAVQVMGEAVGRPAGPATFNRSLTITGVANVLCGASACLGLTPFASAAAMVNLSGVAARAPFLLHALLLMVMGMVPGLSMVLAQIPQPVGNAVLLVAACQLFLIGVRHYATMGLSQRDTFVLGAAVLGGAGVMFLPAEALTALPSTLQYVFGNGMMTGMLVAVAADRLLPEPQEPPGQPASRPASPGQPPGSPQGASVPETESSSQPGARERG